MPTSESDQPNRPILKLSCGVTFVVVAALLGLVFLFGAPPVEAGNVCTLSTAGPYNWSTAPCSCVPEPPTYPAQHAGHPAAVSLYTLPLSTTPINEALR